MNKMLQDLIEKTGSFTPQKLVRRETVLKFECTRCGAEPGEPCLGYKGYVRRSNHMERVALALGHPVKSLLPPKDPPPLPYQSWRRKKPNQGNFHES